MSDLTPLSQLVPAELARTRAMALAQSDDLADRAVGERLLELEGKVRAFRDLRLNPLERVYHRASEHVRFCDDESFAALADAVRDAAGTVPEELR